MQSQFKVQLNLTIFPAVSIYPVYVNEHNPGSNSGYSIDNSATTGAIISGNWYDEINYSENNCLMLVYNDTASHISCYFQGYRN